MKINDDGFSLIELTVVSAIVSLLAALAIPTYAAYKNQGVDATMQSSLKNATSAIEAYAVDRGGTYEGATTAILSDHGYSENPDVAIAVVSATSDRFAIRACATGGRYPSYLFDSTTGAITGDGGSCS